MAYHLLNVTLCKSDTLFKEKQFTLFYSASVCTKHSLRAVKVIKPIH